MSINKRISLDRVSIPLRVVAIVFAGFLAWYANQYVVPMGAKVSQNSEQIVKMAQHHEEFTHRIDDLRDRQIQLRKLLDNKTEKRFTSAEAKALRESLQREIDRLERNLRDMSKEIYGRGGTK